MTNIKSVSVHLYKNGGMSVFITYPNKNKYRNDRVRFYSYIPKTAQKFIGTAQYKQTSVYPDVIFETYSN